MEPLTFEKLDAISSATRQVVKFPHRNLAVTVRELTAAECERIHKVVGDDEANDKQARILACSIGICDANYDSDEGREKLAAMPSRVLTQLADAIISMSAVDIGGIPKNLQGDGDSLSVSASPSESSTPTT